MRGARKPATRRRSNGRVARTVLLTLLSSVAATFVVTPHTSVAGAPLVPDTTAAVDGSVQALVRVGERVVLAGELDEVGGLARENVAALLSSGEVDEAFAPAVDGPVVAAAASADGSTVFLAGGFTSVDGVPRAGLAAVHATTGRLVRRWRPAVGVPVTALAVLGDRLVTGSEAGLTVVRADDGSSMPGSGLRTDGAVTELVATATRLHVGGTFTSVDGRPRAGLAVLTAAGRLTAFSPTGLDGQVGALAVSPDGRRLFAADSAGVHGYLPDRSDLPTWSLRSDGDVRALTAGTHRLFVGGSFEELGPVAVRGLAAVEPVGGTPTGWGLPVAGGDGPAALLLTPQGLVAGGTFDAAGGHPRDNLLRVPTSRPDAVLSAGQDQRLRDDAVVTLAGSVRLPDGGGPAEATWRQIAGAPVELVPSGPATATFRPHPGRDTLAFELVATDGFGMRWRDAVTVEIVATPTVAVIGDSLTARVDGRRDPPSREGATRALLAQAGWDPGSVFWWARGGKTLTTPDRSGRTTFDNLRAATATLGGPVDLVYVGLGTNDSAASADEFGERLGSVLDALDASGARDVVWMGLGFRDADDPRGGRLNPVLEEQVTERGWTVLDFAGHMHSAEVFDPADWLYSSDPTDRLHLTAQGYAERDALMLDALVAARDE